MLRTDASRDINSLPYDKSLDRSKLKAFADDKERVAQMTVLFFSSVENIVGKLKKHGYQHFLSFSHTVFNRHLPQDH